jgi:hypothetical protein
MEHYIDSYQTLWSLLIGGEDYENSRQFKNELALAYQQQQRQQLIVGHTET